jgi:hypothetical protein
MHQHNQVSHLPLCLHHCSLGYASLGYAVGRHFCVSKLVTDDQKNNCITLRVTGSFKVPVKDVLNDMLELHKAK